uniref:Dynein heavy chain linker domain-containing protein n=1 Tax=Callorhinchus milii TaxID=7868 RepID=A0A4W3IE76_CALMI
YCRICLLITFQIVLQNSQVPPIMQDISWPLAIPYKEQRYFRSPSESIANNYTPSANNMKIKDLQKKFSIPKEPKVISKSTSGQVLPKNTKVLLKCLFHSVSSSMEDSKAVIHFTNLMDQSAGYGCDVGELGVDFHRSRPMTPMEQMNIIIEQEEEIEEIKGSPSRRDYERYLHYIEHGIQNHMLEPQDPEQINRIQKLLSNELKTVASLQELRTELIEEIHNDYVYSLRKSIVDYILKDPSERMRLFVCCIPRSFPRRIIRAPVPWHQTYNEAKTWNGYHLFSINPTMLYLQDLWFSQFSNVRFIQLDELRVASLPLLPEEFETLIQNQCLEARNIFQDRWLPACASVFLAHKENWMHLVPLNDCDSTQQVREFFACAASLMSLQLREAVISSLQDLLSFFSVHKTGNDFGKEYNELLYVFPQIMIIKLRVEEPKIVFEPNLNECWDLIKRAFMEILTNAEGIPRVECELFPEIPGEKLVLRTVRAEEFLVSDFVNKALETFHVNTIGPQKYLNVYKIYNSLLNNVAEQDIDNFLKEKHSLEAFVKKIESLQNLRNEIASMHITIPLAMFCLDAVNLNADLCSRAEKLKERLIHSVVEENRNLNNRYISQFECLSAMGHHIYPSPFSEQSIKYCLSVYLEQLESFIYELKKNTLLLSEIILSN